MKIRFSGGESVQQGIQRIAATQIQQSIDDLSNHELDRSEVVHDVRKRCKMIRGMLRLVRPTIGEVYERENTWFRDASRKLSGLRDADATLEALERLREYGAKEVPGKLWDRLDAVLDNRSQVASSGTLDWEPFFVEATQDMQAALDRVPEWNCDEDGFDALKPGLEKTYRRGKRAMRDALKEPSDERLHEWRKHAKYQMYQVRILRDASERELSKRGKRLKRLTDLLGNDHDLVVLHHLLIEHPDFKKLRQAKGFKRLSGAIDARRSVLQKQAKKLGKKLFSASSKKFSGAIEQAWQQWHDDAAVVEAL
ncbi:CHAD domain protein [Rosistilla carotiformis]|uniref:CHAD domain protein n=1 Tax=Rosistilla carotiformis TaxID=2528017 RepID=A0A518JWP6_9BACT|nr:CHAD domain-containing protein [Rosistilla carotiformis]QDV69971.1 CHAD domain protein [Rosistilla carotiformis]